MININTNNTDNINHININNNKQLKKKRKLEDNSLSDSSLDSTLLYSSNSSNSSDSSDSYSSRSYSPLFYQFGDCYSNSYTHNDNNNNYLNGNMINEPPRTKIRRSETEMMSIGYYNDPIKPNLYFLSPGPGILELQSRQFDIYQSKRNQSRVNPLSPYHSPNVMFSNSQINSNYLYSRSISAADHYHHYSNHHNHNNNNNHNYHNNHNIHNHHYDQQKEQHDQQDQHQETDEEILSTLASIVSFDEDDYLEAVFLHFDEE